MIYGRTRKNMGPAGNATVYIIKVESSLGKTRRDIPKDP